MTDASWVGMDAMGELYHLLGWAFRGNAKNFASRFVQWWLRISTIWIAMLVLVVLCAASLIVVEPQFPDVLMAYLTLEVAAVLAIAAPLLLAFALFVAFYLIRALRFVGLFIAAVLGVIS